MDSWLTDRIKENIFKPCLSTTGLIGNHLENRRLIFQDIDERALTEMFVDSFDTSSNLNVWGNTIQLLRDINIYLNLSVRKSSKEYINGADIGLTINRSVYQKSFSSKATYSVLIQCKKINNQGIISDFFHVVKSSNKYQCELMLNITPSSFYFIFVPPSLVDTYSTMEPIVFAKGSIGCSSPIWNMGYMEFNSPLFSFLNESQKSEILSIIVVPALAVDAQKSKNNSIKLEEILSNSLPFWYWFGELLIPGIIGDNRKSTINIASNVNNNSNIKETDFEVRHSISFNFGNG